MLYPPRDFNDRTNDDFGPGVVLFLVESFLNAMRFRSLSWKKKHRRWANFNHWVLHAMLISCHVEPERMGSSSKIMAATAVKDHSSHASAAISANHLLAGCILARFFSSKSVILSAVVVAGSSGAKEGWWRARPCSRYLPTYYCCPT